MGWRLNLGKLKKLQGGLFFYFFPLPGLFVSVLLTGLLPNDQSEGPRISATYAPLLMHVPL